MSKNYTLEDVETLRAKSGVSYEEAVSLLDKYDGDLARALIELEKRGQLNQPAQNSKFSADDAVEWIKKLWQKGMTTHVVIERKGEQLINLSVLLIILMLILGPYAVIAAFILTLVTGCSVSLKTAGKADQTILKGDQDDEGESGDPQPEAAPEKKDDDDFPSITIS